MNKEEKEKKFFSENHNSPDCISVERSYLLAKKKSPITVSAWHEIRTRKNWSIEIRFII